MKYDTLCILLFTEHEFPVYFCLITNYACLIIIINEIQIIYHMVNRIKIGTLDLYTIYVFFEFKREFVFRLRFNLLKTSV